MSVSPLQNFSKPPPVPEVPTVTFTPDCSSLKMVGGGLAQRGHRAGAVDEHRAGELRLPPPVLPPLSLLFEQPASASAASATPTSTRRESTLRFTSGMPFYWT